MVPRAAIILLECTAVQAQSCAAFAFWPGVEPSPGGSRSRSSWEWPLVPSIVSFCLSLSLSSRCTCTCNLQPAPCTCTWAVSESRRTFVQQRYIQYPRSPPLPTGNLNLGNRKPGVARGRPTASFSVPAHPSPRPSPSPSPSPGPNPNPNPNPQVQSQETHTPSQARTLAWPRHPHHLIAPFKSAEPHDNNIGARRIRVTSPPPKLFRLTLTTLITAYHHIPVLTRSLPPTRCHSAVIQSFFSSAESSPLGFNQSARLMYCVRLVPSDTRYLLLRSASDSASPPA